LRAREAAKPIDNDIDAIRKMGVKVLAGSLAQRGDKVRHEPLASAAVAIKLAEQGRRRRSLQP
jgi:hypothetical protein